MESIKVVDDFLAVWKEKARIVYSERIKIGMRKRDKYYELSGKLRDYKSSDAESKNFEESCRIAHIDFEKWQWDNRTLNSLYVHDRKWEETLEKHLSQEVERKKKNLILRVEKKAGKIVDASHLFISSNAEINGFIVGEKCKVSVETISAGGYNIQCLHYRILIKGVNV